MSLSTINTILNTAPIVIQGATRLIKLIRDQSNNNIPEEEIPETIEGIKEEVARLHQRLDTNDESNVEQIKLIEYKLVIKEGEDFKPHDWTEF